MTLKNFIINDVSPVTINDNILDVKTAFNQLIYSHIPVLENNQFIGNVSETDAHCFDSSKPLLDYKYAIERFFVKKSTNWLDVLEAFAKHQSNIMPVLDAENRYLGYYELNDIIQVFNETPFLSEPGNILIIAKENSGYSFSEICQIVETNNSKLLGLFISENTNDVSEITLKVSSHNFNDVLQTFRRYDYEIVSKHQEDSFLESIKDRSAYLNKYLNM